MQWDRIEAAWSEMAIRASGNRSPTAAAVSAAVVEALPDAPPSDATAGTRALDAVETPDGIVA